MFLFRLIFISFFFVSTQCLAQSSEKDPRIIIEMCDPAYWGEQMDMITEEINRLEAMAERLKAEIAFLRAKGIEDGNFEALLRRTNDRIETLKRLLDELMRAIAACFDLSPV